MGIEKHGNKSSSMKHIILFFIIFVSITFLLSKYYNVFALFTDSHKNDKDIQSGTVIIRLIENSPFEGDVTGSPDGHLTDTKVFRGKSLGNLPTYVRAYYKPIIEGYDETSGKWNVMPIPHSAITLKITDENGNWIPTNKNSEAQDAYEDAYYFYYKKILTNNEETTNLKLQIIDLKIPEEYLNIKIRYDIKVYLEASQATNELWKNIFQIENLPQGIDN